VCEEKAVETGSEILVDDTSASQQMQPLNQYRVSAILRRTPRIGVHY
jgi:hypothetical protein